MSATTLTAGSERHLGHEDLIVSKTDTRGHLTYVNHTFVDISGFTEQELLGKPHSIIRHPSMPRAVFRLLWETISSGQEMFAYVVNITKDGGHYWVLAHVTPSFGEGGQIIGYHSNRRAPVGDAVRRVNEVYDQVRHAERQHSNVREAADAGSRAFHEVLAARGQSYAEFVWSLAGGLR